MNFSAKQFAQALNESLKDSSLRKHRRIICNLAKIVASNKDKKMSEKLIDEFGSIIDQEKQTSKIVITTTEPMSHINSINKALREKTGLNYQIENVVDERLIAGSIVNIDNYKIDMSAKSRLQKAKMKDKSRSEKLPEKIQEILKIIIKNID